MGYTIDDKFIQAMRKELSEERVLTDESMARHTTFHIGGNVDVFVLPASIEERTGRRHTRRGGFLRKAVFLY